VRQAEKRVSSRTLWLGAAVVVVAAAFALGFGAGRSAKPSPTVQPAALAEAPRVQDWTCSMHPQIRQPEPGQCPLCGMDLIPVETSGGSDDGPRELHLSPTARKLAEIQTTPVERRFPEIEVRMVGKIDYDETRVSHISAWFPGRIDRLFVDYTGVPVRKGDHLFSIYSPEMKVAQDDLRESLRTGRLVEASRGRLRRWGLTPEQIAEIERSDSPSDHMTIYAQRGGIVIEKHGAEGMYVQTGTRVYTIADLSRVWLKLDAYESDLPWIRYGQDVEFQTDAAPGEDFRGKIALIDPLLNDKTRTVKVRVNVSNVEGKLKPGMFVRAVVRGKVAAGGKVMDAALAGKWICPMHPEIVKDKAGSCDECGMPLALGESLGYVSDGVLADQAPLVVPASAVLVTGKRALVYVEAAGEDGAFEGREVVLGPRAKDHYVVREGLEEGERVVVNGAFKIDSALQLLAKPSMMSPGKAGAAGKAGTASFFRKSAEKSGSPRFSGTGAVESRDAPEAFQEQLAKALTAYYAVQQALSQDNLDGAREAAKGYLASLKDVDMTLLGHEAHMAWMKALTDLKTGGQGTAEAGDIEAARAAFALLSEAMISAVKAFGVAGGSAYVAHCPMAFNDRGANWLSEKEIVENPYFGDAMFSCGLIQKDLSPAPAGQTQ
jgi:Cu(I)/Ag(I) efflux system membrane fusion protein